MTAYKDIWMLITVTQLSFGTLFISGPKPLVNTPLND